MNKKLLTLQQKSRTVTQSSAMQAIRERAHSKEGRLCQVRVPVDDLDQSDVALEDRTHFEVVEIVLGIERPRRVHLQRLSGLNEAVRDRVEIMSAT